MCTVQIMTKLNLSVGRRGQTAQQTRGTDFTSRHHFVEGAKDLVHFCRRRLPFLEVDDMNGPRCERWPLQKIQQRQGVGASANESLNRETPFLKKVISSVVSQRSSCPLKKISFSERLKIFCVVLWAVEKCLILSLVMRLTTTVVTGMFAVFVVGFFRPITYLNFTYWRRMTRCSLF
ncbi:hypothetical protein ScPMuIL_002652 [Solemya velum]